MQVLRWIAILLLLTSAARADDRLVRLFVPQNLVDSGLTKHILPRFSLKTQVRVELVSTADAADVVINKEGRALFDGLGQTWRMEVRNTGHKGTDRFAAWLLSDVGRRTVLGFAPDGEALFNEPSDKERVVATVTLEGNAVLGQQVAKAKCARCHAVDEAGRKTDIGSTPSFFVLRSLRNWQDRFEAFYVLNPHPAFTQIEDVTPPFPPDRPSPIVPVELTLDEVEALLAFVSNMQAADLGAPLIHQ